MRRREQLWDWVWKRGWRRRIAIAGVLVVVAGALIGIWLMRAGLVVAEVGWIMIGLAFVWFLVASVKKVLSDARPVALVAVDVTALAFLVGFPLLLVVLATSSGGGGSAIAALVRNQGETSIAAEAGSLCVFAVPVLVVVVPEVLYRRLPWDDAPGRARELLSAWLAVGAAVATWLYIFLLRFGGQALSGKQPFNTLALAAVALGVVGLLAPFYRVVARSCWKYGIAVVFDPGKKGAGRTAWGEVKCAFRSDAEAKVAQSAAGCVRSDAGPQDCEASGTRVDVSGADAVRQNDAQVIGDGPADQAP